MTYDARTPIAVFLGPSLDLATARAILPANYYPPVQMGDIYRLLATGVRLVVILDGVFHASTPVWQRELLAALKAGITVIGASSMGALRAAELAPYGMIGYGTVFRWYAQGQIEGDDEVALLHAPAADGYRGLSEALVNMRHNLQRAYRAGILAAEHCVDLCAYLKGLSYSERTYAAVFASPSFGRLPRSVQEALQLFLRSHVEDIKRQDAVATLQHCAVSGQQGPAFAIAEMAPGPSITRPVEIWMRGVLTATGELIPLHALLVLASQDQQATRNIVAQAQRRFYLLQWMQQGGVPLPAHARAAFYARWCQRYVHGELAAWLAANGLTQEEFAHEVAERAAEAWLLAQDPSLYGLPWREYLAGVEAAVRNGELARQAVAAWCFVSDWAQRCGIDCPHDVLPQNLEKRQAVAQWLLEQSPVYFGYDQWSADIVFARELQVTGRIAELARTWRKGTHDGGGDVLLGDASVGAT
jgi:hypothetical protein